MTKIHLNFLKYVFGSFLLLSALIPWSNPSRLLAENADSQSPNGTSASVSSGNLAVEEAQSGVNPSSGEKTAAENLQTLPAKPKNQTELDEEKRRLAERNATGENLVTDLKLEATETLQLNEEQLEDARNVSESFTRKFLETSTLRAKNEFLEKENIFLSEAGAENGGFSRFLAQIGALENAELDEYAPIVSRILQEGTAPAAENLDEIRAGLTNETARRQRIWEDLHQTLVEREFLRFELQSNRHIVTQLASMFSMDKRWFWLLGVFAFGALILAVWHDRRHEIRRWLNGGRARQMKLAQILTGCFIFLVSMTLISFLMGETIYRAMLNMTFHSTDPRAVYEQYESDFEKEAKSLNVKIEKAENQLEKNRKLWTKAASERIDGAEVFMKTWENWRDSIQEISVQSEILAGVNRQIILDEKSLNDINAQMASVSGDTLFFLRVKHLVRFLLGLLLTLGTFLGIACFWSEVHARLRKTSNICPHCLSANTLQPCDENGLQMPAGAKSRMVLCTKMVQENPYEVCGYRFDASLRPLTKLSFPTLGIPQVGKTHWLTMLYWEIKNHYYPKLGFSCVHSSVTEEMDRRVEEIMTYRMGTAATQRDSIPLPLVLKYRDRDPLGKSDILADIFDYSGEITTDAACDDYRRERALKSEGFLFFLDPTFPWQPQAEALKRFRRDLKAVKGLRGKESLHLPIAICLTKIDLLPLVKALGENAESEAIRFYEELGRIDPTGLAMNRSVIDQRSALTDELRKKIWPDWDMEAQVNDLFGGRFKFFPLTPVGLDGVGEADLRQRTIAPFGLVEPLTWLLEMSGYPTLDTK